MRAGLLALLAVLGGLGPAAASPQPPTVVVRAEALVTAPEVRLRDCADVQGAAPGLGDAVVASAPAPGQALDVSQGQLRAFLAGSGLAFARVVGAPSCRVTVRAELLRGSALEQEAVASLRSRMGPPPLRGGQYVFEVLTHPQDLLVPVGSRVAAGAGPASPGPGVATVAVEVRWEKSVYRSVPVAVRVSLRAPVLVAARALAYHVVVGPQDVRVESRTLEGSPAGVLQDPREVAGLWTTQAVPSGAVLSTGVLAQAPAVRRGSPVTVTVRTGPLWVSASGHALEDGLRGQAVDVEVDATHKVVRGTVVGPDEVEITLS
jgi:flagella basal body P-ring formation protein FlgA